MTADFVILRQAERSGRISKGPVAAMVAYARKAGDRSGVAGAAIEVLQRRASRLLQDDIEEKDAMLIL